MKHLKPGDRVKIRGYSSKGNCRDGWTGTILFETKDDHYKVNMDEGMPIKVRPSQLIKLKPKVKKEPRVVYLEIDKENKVIQTSLINIKPGFGWEEYPFNSVVKFVEVIE